ncbi:MAG TPA: hypothetical protein IGS52_10435 [Oscillatoriaceae cyanobacterium M33_DOE_052]|nr:hypothetical protein [Oscillatoriaceae cyanobacterium M33_DOE_052]
MLEILVWSLFVGSLGMEASLAGGWLRMRQIKAEEKEREEEEILTEREGKNNLTALAINGLTDAAPTAISMSMGTAWQSQPSGEWEYKIVRANRDLFRNPEVFQQLITEEALAGWSLLEKLDDRRVRFKRPVALRDTIDVSQLNFDPYRSHYGPETEYVSLVGAVAAVVAMILPAYLGYALVTHAIAQSPTPQSPPALAFPPDPSPPTFP